MYNKLKDTVDGLKDRLNYSDVRYETSTVLEFIINNDFVTISKNGTINGGSFKILQNGIPVLFSFTRIDDIYRDLQQKINVLCRNKSSLCKMAKTDINTGKFSTKINRSKYVYKLEDKINIIKYYTELIRRQFNKISNVRFAYKEIYTEKFFYNSDGIDVMQELHDIALSCEVTFKYNGTTYTRTFHDGSSNNYDIILNRENEIVDFCNEIMNSIELKRLQSAQINDCTNIILDQDLSATLVHEIIGHFSEADNTVNFNNIERNHRIGTDKLNIYDSALTGARGYSFFDDEGTKCQEQQLISNGRVNGRLHNRKTAYLFNEIPKGNARSIDYSYTPICRMRHTSVSNGNTNLKDLICSLKNGILICGSKGGSAGENFSLSGAYGRVIRNGKLEELIDNIYIYGNAYEVLSGLSEICNDKKIINKYGGCGKFNQYPLAVSYSAPSLFFSQGLKVGVAR